MKISISGKLMKQSQYNRRTFSWDCKQLLRNVKMKLLGESRFFNVHLSNTCSDIISRQSFSMRVLWNRPSYFTFCYRIILHWFCASYWSDPRRWSSRNRYFEMFSFSISSKWILRNSVIYHFLKDKSNSSRFIKNFWSNLYPLDLVLLNLIIYSL